MRRPIFRSTEEDALRLFDVSPTFELASINRDGAPLLRTLHGVVVERRLAFHASPVGEKLDVVGREAVAQVSRTIATIPSYFTDPQRACPATTLYASAQAHGIVTVEEDPVMKARVLAALMKKLQPEGGYAPIDAESPDYRKAIAGIAVLSMPLDRVDGKAKLLQHKTPDTRRLVLEGLWSRGAEGDAEAIEEIRASSPGDPTPSFLEGPAGTTLAVALMPGEAEKAARLVADLYWNDDVPPPLIANAHRGSTAWVGARDESGDLVATARAISDRAKHAWIYDVAVAGPYRRRGVGDRVVRLLLEHPAVRGAKKIHLGTRDAMAFYERMGFVAKATIPRPYTSTEMVLLR